MNIDELYFVPHSDAGIDELELIEEHNNLINNKQYEEAVTLLEENQSTKGMTASLLNLIQNKIRSLQLFLLNEFVASPIEYFSDTEPTAEEMGDKIIWIKPWD